MKKRISLTIDNEETIKKLVASAKDFNTISKYYGLSIEKIKKVIDNPVKSFSKLDDDYWERVNSARDIAILAMAIAVKTMIPEENYKNIVLKIIPGNLPKESGKSILGTQCVEQKKSVASFYLSSIEDLAIGKIYEFCVALGVFAHELHHTKQYLNSQKKEELTIPNLIYSLENIAYHDDYTENYSNIFYETEAFYVGSAFSADYLRFLLNKKTGRDQHIDILMQNRPDWHNALFDFDTQCGIVKKLLNIIEDKNIKITDGMLRKYPILNTLYNTNGVFYDEPMYSRFLSQRMNNSSNNEQERDLCRLLLEVSKKSDKKYEVDKQTISPK